ncbi:YOR378W-like protein [Lipomyces doorenjongii]
MSESMGTTAVNSPSADNLTNVDQMPIVPLKISYREFSLSYEILFVALISLSQLLTQAALGQGVATLHIVGEHFGVNNPAELAWFIAAYSLTVGTFILPAGRWGDLFGNRRLFIIGYAWFALWSIIAGFSVYSDKVLFHFCRALQGIGPALLLPNGLALLGKTYPPSPRKNMVFSIFGSVAPGGFAVGAAFSSLFAELVWWPWAYWVMGIICIALTVLSNFTIPAALDNGTSRENCLERLDLAGTFTGLTGLVLFNIAWNQASVVGWQMAYTYVILIIGILFLIIFFVIEARFGNYPLVPLRDISANTCFVFACVGAGWASFGIWVYYYWQFSQNLRSELPLIVVARQSPTVISGAAAAIITGRLLNIFPPSYIMFMAMVAFCVGCILFATMPVNQIYWAQTFVSMVVMPFGMDMSFPSSTVILSNSMTRDHQGIAASLVNTIVNYSVSLGLGFAGTVESQINKSGNDLLMGYRSAWYLGIGLSGMGVLVSLYYIVNSTRLEKVSRSRSKSEKQGV